MAQMIDRDRIFAIRWLRPVAHLFAHPSLWHPNRRSVPRGVAVGLFVGLILPVGQIFIAALLAVPSRANVPAAAAATFISNPVTFGPIYFAAHATGRTIRSLTDFATPGANPGAISTMLDLSLSTGIGLVIFACVSSALGFVSASIWWRLRARRRWRRRSDQSDRQSG
jgi:uncharacterized protein (DUF2062 family)